ncbi:MAG: MBL fold metallo-hydrolase [Bosea sp. (in: a-proteobacteria)]|jgi:L-ascorbate metabolism protein UlaG (beta-lactamase superfamily)
MNRRKLLTLLGLPALATLLGGAYAARARGQNPYYQGPVKVNFDGLTFSDGREITKGFREFFQWQLQGGKESWPASYPTPPQDVPPARSAGLRVSHVGHATFLIQVAGLNIITDPLFSERASPFQFAGPKRVNAPGIAFDALPKIDAILITHNHYDHLDLISVHRIFDRDRCRIIAPLGNDAIIKAKRPDIMVEARDWGDKVALSADVAITLVPAYHWSARGAFDRRMALWASYVIAAPQGRIYHIGDTGYHDGTFFREHGAEFGPFRLAILPIGAYEPRWFMADNHMNPDEAVKVMTDLRAEAALGHHWGTFQLTNEGVGRPLEALGAARKAAGIADEHFVASLPGMVWQPPAA